MKPPIADILPQICSLENDAVIIANGQFPNDDCLVNIVKNTKHIIVCDGALHHLIAKNIEPHFIIGDCDSIDSLLWKKYYHKIIHLKEQESNDLTKALFLAKGKNLNNIIILGATGLREDHTLGNISILAQHVHHFKNIKMISDYGVFTAHDHHIILKTIPHQQISFFSFNSITTITCEQLKWQLHDFKMEFWNHATLNETIDNHIDIHIDNGTIIVFRTFEIRN